MENKLEQLLNSLIEKGWKPFGENVKQIVRSKLFLGYVPETPVPLATLEPKFSWVLRELVSKESGLWQFVCENGMVEETIRELNTRTKKPYIRKDRIITSKKEYRPEFYEYRLIESALKDENELESFILDNIKIEG